MGISDLILTVYKDAASKASPNFGTNAYYLQAETCVHMFLRLPTQAGLPGKSSDHTTQVLTIDVGICTETISITGVINTTSIGSGDPSKTNLETIIRTWWDYGATVGNLPIIKIDTSQYYSGNFKSATFTREGGLEDRWQFEIIFVVRAAA